MPKDIDLTYVKPGDPISARPINALIAEAKAFKGFAQGFVSSMGVATRPLPPGRTLIPVAVVSSIAAATSVEAAGKSTVTPTSVTAKRLGRNSSGEDYYEPTTATDLECKWRWKTAVTVASGKWRRGLVIGDELFIEDCGEFPVP